VLKEAPISRDSLEEIGNNDVHCFEEIIDNSMELERGAPPADFDLDNELDPGSY
jgi:hypothetical protein